MHVAVLGGGLLGCCIAPLVARRGVRVTLFDRNEALLCGAATNNEGKVHLGYVFAGDSSLNTARRMIAGALAFRPIVASLLERADVFNLSAPFDYLLHRDSQKSVDEFARHLAAVHTELRDASRNRESDYFDRELFQPQAYARAELENAYDTTQVLAAFRTPEIAVDPLKLADALRSRVRAEPNIELRLGQNVTAVYDAESKFCVQTADGTHPDAFDQVANALWDGRLAVDATRGLRPARRWLYRLKYGVRVQTPIALNSTTVVLGPFGDTVAYADGARYFSWYPAGMRAMSSDVMPPSRPVPSEDEQRMIVTQSIEALSRIVPALGALSADDLASAKLLGGIIFAWGQSDIDDPASELHRRCDIGVTSQGGYHSVDPGKLTTAPYFARVCADRIVPKP